MSIFQIDRRSIANFDLLLLAFVLALNVIGIVNLSSAAGGGGLWKSQLFRLLLSLIPAFIALAIPYTNLERLTPLIYFSSLILLLGVHWFGVEVNGARSWYDLKYYRLQPSELMKIALILALARMYHRYSRDEPWGIRELFWPVLAILVPLGMIAAEPDLGTGLVIMLISAVMLLFIGIRRKILVAALLIGLFSFYPVWHWGLKEHQKERILNVAQPERDPMGTGYNALQSKIAIGSGGIFGKGYKKGTMHMLRFLPEQQTDFVFSVWAEEWGLVWVAAALLLYTLLVRQGLVAAGEAKDRFGLLIALGCTALFFWHIMINVAMVVGLFPVIGVPLPFMSYGGSNLTTFMIAVALILNVRMRKYYF